MKPSSKGSICFVLPGGTGYRTVLLTLRDYYHAQGFNCETIDNLSFQRADFKKVLDAAFGESVFRCALLSELDLVTGIHRFVRGTPTRLLTDHDFPELFGTDRTGFHQLEDSEFDSLNEERERVQHEAESRSIEEMIQIVRTFEKDTPKHQSLLRTIQTTYNLEQFTDEDYFEYLLDRYGRDQVRALYRHRYKEHIQKQSSAYQRLRYNELTHLGRICAWTRSMEVSIQEEYPEFASKTMYLPPLIHLPSSPLRPDQKLKSKTLVAFGKGGFNTQGELSALRLLSKLPPEYRVKLIGVTRSGFEAGLQTMEGTEMYLPLLSRVDFLHHISNEEVARSLSEASFFLRVGGAGRMPIGICEALSHGLPVVCAGAETEEGVIDHGKNGFLLDTPRIMDAQLSEVASWILSLEQEPARYKEVSESAFERAKLFDVRQWSTILHSLVECR